MKVYSTFLLVAFLVSVASANAQQTQKKMKISTISVDEDEKTKNDGRGEQNEVPRENKKKEKMITKPYTKKDTVILIPKSNGGNTATKNR